MNTLSILARFALIGSVAACGAAASTPGPHAEAENAPRLVILEHSYFGGGFDSPLLVVFPSGRLLVRRLGERFASPTYSELAVPARALDSLMNAIGAGATTRLRDTLFDYNPGWTDQHSYYVLLVTPTGQRVTQLRAALSAGDTLRGEVPDEYRTLFRNVRMLAAREAREWIPDSIEVSVWPYEYAPDEPSLVWPADWPNLESKRWIREKNEFVEEVRLLRLPFADAARLDSLARARRTRQALRIGTRKWAFGYRWLFPGEAHWRQLAGRVEG